MRRVYSTALNFYLAKMIYILKVISETRRKFRHCVYKFVVYRCVIVLDKGGNTVAWECVHQSNADAGADPVVRFFDFGGVHRFDIVKFVIDFVIGNTKACKNRSCGAD